MNKILLLALLSLLALTACGQSGGQNNAENNTDVNNEVDATDAPDAEDSGNNEPDGNDDPDVPDEPDEPLVETLVETNEGPVEGVADNGILIWKGVPFAGDTSGEMRWKPPGPAPTHEDVLDVSEFGPVCINQGNGPGEGDTPESEDCLNLNIWTPSGAREGQLPVMVRIAGRYFAFNDPTIDMRNPRKWAEEGVVVVSFNYRVSALGFISHPDLATEGEGYGNYGMLDQVAALRWVKDNIASFGGDPERVTIGGWDGGATSVCTLMASPLAEGLFHQALMESGNCLSSSTLFSEFYKEDEKLRLENFGYDFSHEVGCGNEPNSVDCMRNASVEDLRAAFNELSDYSNDSFFPFGPVVDGHFLTTSPIQALVDNKMHNVPLLMGSNLDEHTRYTSRNTTRNDFEELIEFFGDRTEGIELYNQYDGDYYRAYSAIFSDLNFNCRNKAIATQHTNNGNPTWLYNFNHETQYGRDVNLGVFNGSQVTYTLGTLDHFFTPLPDATFTATEEDQALSELMIDLWMSFVKTGNPSIEGVRWDPYNADMDNSLELKGDTQEMVNAFRLEHCLFLGYEE